MNTDVPHSFTSRTSDETADWLWCVEPEEPFSIDLPETEQVDLLLRGLLVEANDAFALGFGCPLQEMLGLWRVEKILQGTQPGPGGFLLSVVRSNYRLEDFETTELTREGGTRIVLHTFIGTIRNRKLLRVWGTSKDVTQARELQSQFRLRQAAIDSSNDGFVIADARDGEYPLVYANDRFLAMTGYERDDVLGRNCRFLQGPDTDPEVTWKIRHALANGKRFQGEILNYRRDGSRFWNFLRVSPVRDKYFNLTHFVGLATDITTQKQTQLTAEKQRDELAHVSRAATLVELGAALAHEISQPLAAILRNAEAARRFLDRPSPDLEMINNILEDIIRDDHRAGEIMSGIREHLVRQSAEHAPLKINQVIEDSLKLLHSDLIMKRIDVRLNLAEELPMAHGDAIQLQQVVLNLVLNSADATCVPSKRSIISIQSCVQGAEIHVSVADRGSGIPPDDLERVFDPFHTTKANGMGVGLSICRRIVDAHGGRMWAENRGHGGARISFSVPIRKFRKPR